MTEGKDYCSRQPTTPPEWYWVRGLHDACIIGVEPHEYPIDYSKYSKKNKPDRNMLSLKIDARQALYDIHIKEIRFYNYKILPESVDLINLEPSEKNKIWWLADQLTEQHGKFELDILLEIRLHKNRFFKIRFDRAEIDRT